MKQTAVEWLFYNLNISGGGEDIRVFEQAKAMEKEQITDSYIMGSYDMAEKKFRPEQYYTETYESKTNL